MGSTIRDEQDASSTSISCLLSEAFRSLSIRFGKSRPQEEQVSSLQQGPEQEAPGLQAATNGSLVSEADTAAKETFSPDDYVEETTVITDVTQEIQKGPVAEEVYPAREANKDETVNGDSENSQSPPEESVSTNIVSAGSVVPICPSGTVNLPGIQSVPSNSDVPELQSENMDSEMRDAEEDDNEDVDSLMSDISDDDDDLEMSDDDDLEMFDAPPTPLSSYTNFFGQLVNQMLPPVKHNLDTSDCMDLDMDLANGGIVIPSVPGMAMV